MSGTNGKGPSEQEGNGRSGYSGTSLLLMFVGGALAGAVGAYLAQAENRSRVGSIAKRTWAKADQLPQAVRDASHAAHEAFSDSYSAQAKDAVKNSGTNSPKHHT